MCGRSRALLAPYNTSGASVGCWRTRAFLAQKCSTGRRCEVNTTATQVLARGIGRAHYDLLSVSLERCKRPKNGLGRVCFGTRFHTGFPTRCSHVHHAVNVQPSSVLSRASNKAPSYTCSPWCSPVQIAGNSHVGDIEPSPCVQVLGDQPEKLLPDLSQILGSRIGFDRHPLTCDSEPIFGVFFAICLFGLSGGK